jgi:hypothetical protein
VAGRSFGRICGAGKRVVDADGLIVVPKLYRRP